MRRYSTFSQILLIIVLGSAIGFAPFTAEAAKKILSARLYPAPG